MIKLYTIGFTKKSAEDFFNALIKNRVAKLIDIRINNTSQLAGFTRGNDLKYFLKKIAGIEYEHIIDFAPTKEMLNDYRNKIIDWAAYENIYLDIIKKRDIKTKYNIKDFDNSCFLCSEELPDKCHRRLLVEYLKDSNPNTKIEINHIL